MARAEAREEQRRRAEAAARERAQEQQLRVLAQQEREKQEAQQRARLEDRQDAARIVQQVQAAERAEQFKREEERRRKLEYQQELRRQMEADEARRQAEGSMPANERHLNRTLLSPNPELPPGVASPLYSPLRATLPSPHGPAAAYPGQGCVLACAQPPSALTRHPVRLFRSQKRNGKGWPVAALTLSREHVLRHCAHLAPSLRHPSCAAQFRGGDEATEKLPVAREEAPG